MTGIVYQMVDNGSGTRRSKMKNVSGLAKEKNIVEDEERF